MVQLVFFEGGSSNDLMGGVVRVRFVERVGLLILKTVRVTHLTIIKNNDYP